MYSLSVYKQCLSDTETLREVAKEIAETSDSEKIFYFLATLMATATTHGISISQDALSQAMESNKARQDYFYQRQREGGSCPSE